MNEVKEETTWREIKGYEGLYMIDNKASIWRMKGTGLDGRTVKGHIVTSSRTKQGLRYIALWKDGQRRNYMLHKLYSEAFDVSENEAMRRIYKGFSSNDSAIYNVRSLLQTCLSVYEREQEEGFDRKDEILYIEQFLNELKEDIIGYSSGRNQKMEATV